MSDYLRKLIERAEHGLLDWDAGLEELAADKSNAIEADSFDQLAWRMLTDSVPKLDAESQRLTEELGETLAQALEDLFNLLHQGDPRFTDKGEMLPEYEINLVVLFDLSESEEFKALYDETRYDEYQTAFALLTMEEFIKSAFGRVAEQREQMRQAAERQDEAMGQLAKAVDEAMDGDENERCQGLEQALAEADAAQQGVADARAAAQQAAQQATEDLRQAAMEAKQEIDDERALMGGYGVGAGQLQQMPFEERRALAERLNQNRLGDLAKLLGAFRPFADGERRRKVKHAPAEVFDYQLSNDLTRLTPAELTALAVPELEDHFWVRWAQHELLTTKIRGPENLGQGPIIVVCDESSSMGMPLDAQGNTREAWSKAVSLALCDQARRGKRDFTYIGFASESQVWRIDFPGGVTPIEKVIEFTEHFYSGGTAYERPLTDAMTLIEEYEKVGKPKPDIVFITDDDCYVSPEFVTQWCELKERAEVTVFGIQIGGSGYRNTMAQLADRVINIDQLNATPEGVKELFRGI